MVNSAKLRGKIVENGLTLEKVAKAINLNKSTISRKLSKNGDDFTIKQADDIVSLLNLTADEATAIFFSQFVADMRNGNCFKENMQ